MVKNVSVSQNENFGLCPFYTFRYLPALYLFLSQNSLFGLSVGGEGIKQLIPVCVTSERATAASAAPVLPPDNIQTKIYTPTPTHTDWTLGKKQTYKQTHWVADSGRSRNVVELAG
jgi:hypothetical protein